jgi:putative thioredoxin
VELIRRLSGEDRDQVRDRVVEYFDILGPEDPRVAPARRALASALF